MKIVLVVVSAVFAFLYAFKVQEILGVNTLGLSVGFLALSMLA